jgi:hypothetical protein
MTRKTILFGLLVFIFLLMGGISAQAALRPEWTWKGEEALNRKRKNESYTFKVFKTEDAYLSRLREGRFYPLLKYLGERYQADPEKMALDSLASISGEPTTYRIILPDNGVVHAQRVDVYSTVDNNTLGDPIFEYYQLYAVSEKDAEVLFDQFEVKERSRAGASLMNALIPGAGQIYKGHTFKGGVILGSEIVLGAAAYSAHKKYLYFKEMADSGVAGADSWHSKEISLRRLRNLSLVAMGGVWAFSLYDALATESMPFISVSAPQGGQFSLAPATDSAGLALVYRF